MNRSSAIIKGAAAGAAVLVAPYAAYLMFHAPNLWGVGMSMVMVVALWPEIVATVGAVVVGRLLAERAAGPAAAYAAISAGLGGLGLVAYVLMPRVSLHGRLINLHPDPMKLTKMALAVAAAAAIGSLVAAYARARDESRI